jgi:hypothetical protein
VGAMVLLLAVRGWDRRRELPPRDRTQFSVAGIGNVYRSELCFLLGASPWAPVADLMEPAGAISRWRGPCCAATPGGWSARRPVRWLGAGVPGCTSAPPVRCRWRLLWPRLVWCSSRTRSFGCASGSIMLAVSTVRRASLGQRDAVSIRASAVAEI